MDEVGNHAIICMIEAVRRLNTSSSLIAPSMFAGSLRLVTFALVISQLAYRARGLQCYSSTDGLVHRANPQMTTCRSRHFSCFEHYYTLRGSNTSVYEAGCGSYYMSIQMQVATYNKIAEERTKDCSSDGCNRNLLADLESSHRICYLADRHKNYTTFAVLCASNVKECYQDLMIGATEPTYFAGCGECPSYTLYCSTCTSSYCHVTEAAALGKPARRVVVEGTGDDKDSQISDDFSSDACTLHCRCLHLVALALLTLCLFAGGEKLHFMAF